MKGNKRQNFALLSVLQLLLLLPPLRLKNPARLVRLGEVSSPCDKYSMAGKDRYGHTTAAPVALPVPGVSFLSDSLTSRRGKERMKEGGEE